MSYCRAAYDHSKRHIEMAAPDSKQYLNIYHHFLILSALDLERKKINMLPLVAHRTVVDKVGAEIWGRDEHSFEGMCWMLIEENLSALDEWGSRFLALAEAAASAEAIEAEILKARQSVGYSLNVSWSCCSS